MSSAFCIRIERVDHPMAPGLLLQHIQVAIKHAGTALEGVASMRSNCPIMAEGGVEYFCGLGAEVQCGI